MGDGLLGGDGEGDEESNFYENLENLELNKNSKLQQMDTLENQVEMKRWLDFCRSHSHVKCTEYEIPHGVLPKGYNGVLIDVKVCGNTKRRVPDDKIYMAHAELRAKVARGNCVLELNKIEKGRISETKYIFLVFALKKFSGGLGDEDDSDYAQSQWFHYFIKSINTTKKVISTDKENGEAAHISSRKLFGQTYFCFGSKNVHLLARNADDISKYKDGRFEFARRIAVAFYNTVLENPEIPENTKQSLIDFMQINHFTAVAEVLQPDNQHVVNLSHLKHAELRFICWTKPDFLEDFENSNSLCVLPINDAIDKARGFGLKTIDYEVIEIQKDPVAEIEELIPAIRKDHGHEGKVLYFIDASGCTIGLIKKKTAWYIILRALREKVASFSRSSMSMSLHDKVTKITKRIKEIQRWLGFSDLYTNGWIELSTGFAKWLDSKRPINMNIRSNFPVIFDEYLTQNPLQRLKYEALLDKFEGDSSLR